LKQAYKPNFVIVIADDRQSFISTDRYRPALATYPKTPSRFPEPSGGPPEYAFPYLVLHREEFTWPRLLPGAPVSPYLTISPITAMYCRMLACRNRQTNSLSYTAGLFSVALVVTGRVCGPGRYSARCPAVFGLSSLANKAKATARPASIHGI